MYHEARMRSPEIFSILMGSFVFISVSYIYGTLLTANKNLKQLNLLAAATVLLNIGLNLLLIPSHKAFGAAVANISSQAFYATCQIIIAHRMVGLDLNYRFFGKLFLFGILITASGYVLHRLPPLGSRPYPFPAHLCRIISNNPGNQTSGAAENNHGGVRI